MKFSIAASALGLGVEEGVEEGLPAGGDGGGGEVGSGAAGFGGHLVEDFGAVHQVGGGLREGGDLEGGREDDAIGAEDEVVGGGIGAEDDGNATGGLRFGDDAGGALEV